MKETWITIVLIALVLLLAPLVVPLFVPWSEINCEHQDINIKTGQSRCARKIWFLNVTERIEDTPLSLALHGEKVDVADIKAWHHVNTFSPYIRHSPHYIFHGALCQVNELETIGVMLNFTSERKNEIAKTILTAWQQAGHDDGADPVIDGLNKELISHVKFLQSTSPP